MSKREDSFKKKLGLSIVTSGIAIGLLVSTYNAYNTWHYPRLLNSQFTELVASNGADVFKQNAIKDVEIKVDADDFKVLDLTPNDLEGVYPEHVIGGIYIPDGNIKLPITLGASVDYAKSTAVAFQEDFSLQQDNVVLGSHSTKANALFTRLQELEEGADIYVTDKDTIQLYQVTKRLRSKSGREDLMLPREDKMLTLFTGYDNEAQEQLIIQAKLITSDKYSQETVGELFDVFGY